MHNDAKAIAAANIMSKSLGLGVLLTICFGGLGLLYASVFWGLIGIGIELIILFISVLSFGLGLFILIPWHIVTVLIAIICINNYNKRLLSSL